MLSLVGSKAPPTAALAVAGLGLELDVGRRARRGRGGGRRSAAGGPVGTTAGLQPDQEAATPTARRHASAASGGRGSRAVDRSCRQGSRVAKVGQESHLEDDRRDGRVRAHGPRGASVPASGRPYLEFLRVPALSVGLYTLEAGAVDGQSPHTEDEVYVVMSGRARITGRRRGRDVGPGSVVYVPATVPHRFHDIAERLEILVVFAPAEYSQAARPRNGRRAGWRRRAPRFAEIPVSSWRKKA